MDKIVAELKKAVQLAEAGEVRSFAMVLVSPNDDVSAAWEAHGFVLTGALEYVKQQTLAAARATSDDVLNCQDEEDSEDGQSEAQDESLKVRN